MAIERINLNVFSNVASAEAKDCLVPEAIRAYFSCFDGARGAGETIVRVFLDPKPHRANHDAWRAAIREALPDIPVEIVETEGLISSFIRAIEMSECAYAMQLEHDFVFRRSLIPHGIGEIVATMAAGDIEYMRFNKRANIKQGYDLFMEEVSAGPVPLCRVNGRSNNPHLIDTAYYRKVVLPILTDPHTGKLGLEGGLDRYIGGGHVYGPLGWPKTVQHLDGRHVRPRDNLARKLYLLRHRKRM
jgi:hypothetical protein